MSWDDFDTFCQVVAHGSFTAAAQAMNRPKSSISASIRRLEEHLNIRLLERTTRRVSVTDAGALLYENVSPLIDELRDVALDTQAQSGSIRGTLRIAAPYEFGAHHLGEISCRMMLQYPELQVIVDVVHASVDPFAQQYDIVFSMVDRDLPPSSAIMARVFKINRSLFAAPDFILQWGLPERPEDLAELPLLAGMTESEWEFDGVDGGVVSVPVVNARMRSNNAGIRKLAALRGLGVARITSTFCEDAVSEGTLQQLLPSLVCDPLHVYALLPARRLMPPKVRAFLDMLSTIAAERPEPT